MKSKSHSSVHRFTLLYHPQLPSMAEVQLVGGYIVEDDKDTIILFRYGGRNNTEPIDGDFFLFGRKHGIRLWAYSLDVESDDWDRFAKLAIGARFRLGERWWRKVSISDLKKKMAKQIQIIYMPVRKPVLK